MKIGKCAIMLTLAVITLTAVKNYKRGLSYTSDQKRNANAHRISYHRCRWQCIEHSFHYQRTGRIFPFICYINEPLYTIHVLFLFDTHRQKIPTTYKNNNNVSLHLYHICNIKLSCHVVPSFHFIYIYSENLYISPCMYVVYIKCIVDTLFYYYY